MVARLIIGTRRVGSLILLGLAGLWLALACVAQMQSRSAAQNQPWLALAWDSANPTAMTRLAEFYAEARTSAADSKTASELARSALIGAPLNGAALRVLGFEAERAGDAGAARRLMTASDTVTKRDRFAQLWLLEQALGRKDFERGFARAEAVLRRDASAAPLVFALMGQTLAEPAAISALSLRLTRKPTWREAFLEDVAVKATDVEHVRRLYTALEARGAPATTPEAAALVARLAAERRYGEAYALWKSRAGGSAQARSEAIYGADFRPRPGPPPFNWRLADDGAAFAELGEGPDGGPALHVQLQTGSTTVLAEQLLLLPGGRYRLDGAAWLGNDLAARAMAWRVECAESGALVMERRFDLDAPGGWRPFGAEFDVPGQGCAAQRLLLRGVAQDRFDTIEAWHKGLRLSSASASLAAPQGAAAPAEASR